MIEDHYRAAAAGWAGGATLVYAPIATLLVARAPVALDGTRVLDVGAGTGVGTAPLRARGVATVIETDLSRDMLAWHREHRPAAVVADVMQLPFPNSTFDALLASFVLNHVTNPVAGLTELTRVVRPAGAVLATVYSNTSHSANRDRVDEIARAHGWKPPAWYTTFKATAAPLLGTRARMELAASAAGHIDIAVDEEAVDLGITEPGGLVDYRFGQAQFTDWQASLSPVARSSARLAAIRAITDTMEPYRPRVVFLAARTAG